VKFSTFCDRNIYNLVEDVSELLDTPSKRTLWRCIIPLLSKPHQAFCEDVLGLSRHTDTTRGNPEMRVIMNFHCEDITERFIRNFNEKNL